MSVVFVELAGRLIAMLTSFSTIVSAPREFLPNAGHTLLTIAYVTQECRVNAVPYHLPTCVFATPAYRPNARLVSIPVFAVRD
jgi:hypothetical protein